MVLQTTVCSLKKGYNYSKRRWFFDKKSSFISRSTERCHLRLARLRKFSFRQALGKPAAFAYLRMIRRDRIQPNKNERPAQETDFRRQGDGPKTGAVKSDGKLAPSGKEGIGFVTFEPKRHTVPICQRSGFLLPASQSTTSPGKKGTGRRRSAAGPLSVTLLIEKAQKEIK